MKRKISYIIFVLLLALSLIAGTGCSKEALAPEQNFSVVSEEPNIEPVEEEALQQTQLLYDASAFLADIPAWDGENPYCEVNGNKPDFTKEEIWTATQESLDPLDDLGRCGTANSCIGLDGMPDQPRGDISEVHPTGWHTDSYDGVEGGKLYNRCHLIAHKLSGDDAVPRNLITGTSYMNRDGMLPFEDAIEEYVESTGNHVMYRVTPCFVGKELVARGVHMQAVSVEDNGQGLAFNVFCYNVQPGIYIDYMTGDNRRANASEKADQAESSEKQPESDKQTDNSKLADNNESSNDTGSTSEVRSYVLNTNTHKFHYPTCGSVKDMKDKNKQEVEDTRENIISKGYDPCGNCHP